MRLFANSDENSQHFVPCISMEVQTLLQSTGRKIKALRKARNLSQEDLARMFNVDRTTIGTYEKGEGVPFEFLLGLTVKLNVKIHLLLPTQLDNDVITDPELNRAITYLEEIDEDTRKAACRLISSYYFDYLRETFPKKADERIRQKNSSL
jgi:transcriptional regulator with XRE-family HTH domain